MKFRFDIIIEVVFVDDFRGYSNGLFFWVPSHQMIELLPVLFWKVRFVLFYFGEFIFVAWELLHFAEHSHHLIVAAKTVFYIILQWIYSISARIEENSANHLYYSCD